MKFSIDKQTINDLELYEKAKGEPSVIRLFNYTKSHGGRRQLEFWFSNPVNEFNLLTQRISICKYFQKAPDLFDIDHNSLDFIEHYLIQSNVPQHYSFSKSLFRALGNKLRQRNEYYVIKRGIYLLVNTLLDIYDYAKKTEVSDPEYIANWKATIIKSIEKTTLKSINAVGRRRRYSPFRYGKLDYFFRKKQLLNVKELLAIIYQYDAYTAIGLAAKNHGLSFPEFTHEPNQLQIKGLFHPFLTQPVCNDFEFKAETNICFLTGPNMAGKSTFLKSLGSGIYLSHIGFPVPAKSFRTSIFNGLLTTINLSDNINKGYSHYYSEVIRIKYVAEQINQVGNIFVVFDELFRGTNVKDAFEASLSVIRALSKLNNGLFAISTHILEVAEELKDNPAIFFNYFEANLVNDAPNYSYVLKEGITDERIGMYILKKEKVIETIEKSIKS